MGGDAPNYLYIVKIPRYKLIKQRKWVDQFPSIISTLGVFGTFLGITKGLVVFDTADLNGSIPILLDGMKTAFFTSLFGMMGSLIINRVVSNRFETEEEISESETAANMIVKSIDKNFIKLSEAIAKEYALLSNDIFKKQVAISETLKEISDNGSKCLGKMSVDLEQLKDDVEEIKGHLEELKDTVSQIDSRADSDTGSMEDIARLRALLMTATTSISTMDNNLDEICCNLKLITEKSDSDQIIS